MQRFQVLFALAYGHRGPDGHGGYVPGRSNEAMAQVIKDQDNRYDRVSVQQEIGTAMREIGGEPDFEVMYGGKKYLTTEQVIDAMLEDLRQEDVDPKSCDIHVLCHPIHWSGCKWILQARGIAPWRVFAKVPYDSKSHQFQGRNAFNAWLYKIKAGITKLLKGEISIFGPKAQEEATMATTTTRAEDRDRTPLWKMIVGGLAVLMVVAAIGFGVYSLVRANGSVPPPALGQLYEVMLHQETAKFQVRQANGSMATRDQQVVTVVFVGKDHGRRPPQYVPRELVFRDETIPMGHGKWVVVDYPTVEGVDYLTRVEFRYNGELGAQRQPYPQGTPRQ